MANDSLPQGKWLKKKTEHWLRYKKFHMFSDATGSDHIALQAELRKAMQEATEILDQHSITIGNMYSENVLDHRMYDNVYRIAIGFESKEDLAMATLVLNADDFQ